MNEEQIKAIDVLMNLKPKPQFLEILSEEDLINVANEILSIK